MAIDIKGGLTRKIGPLPAWGWAVALGGGFLVWRALSGKGGGGSSSVFGGDSSVPTGAGGGGGGTSSGTGTVTIPIGENGAIVGIPPAGNPVSALVDAFNNGSSEALPFSAPNLGALIPSPAIPAPVTPSYRQDIGSAARSIPSAYAQASDGVKMAARAIPKTGTLASGILDTREANAINRSQGIVATVRTTASKAATAATAAPKAAMNTTGAKAEGGIDSIAKTAAATRAIPQVVTKRAAPPPVVKKTAAPVKKAISTRGGGRGSLVL